MGQVAGGAEPAAVADTEWDELTRLARRTPAVHLHNLLSVLLQGEEELKRAVVLLLETTHQLAEGAGAAATAAAVKLKDQLKGKKVAVVISGGNLITPMLKEILKNHESSL